MPIVRLWSCCVLDDLEINYILWMNRQYWEGKIRVNRQYREGKIRKHLRVDFDFGFRVFRFLFSRARGSLGNLYQSRTKTSSSSYTRVGFDTNGQPFVTPWLQNVSKRDYPCRSNLSSELNLSTKNNLKGRDCSRGSESGRVCTAREWVCHKRVQLTVRGLSRVIK